MTKVLVLFYLIFFLYLFSDSESKFVCDATKYRFQCEDGECISSYEKCDFKSDCSDGSDEKGCSYPACNLTTEFQCNNGRCISKRWKCDQENDCYDNSDEIPETCANHTCATDEFQCKGSKACYSNSWKCDGDFDCDEGDDELGCEENCGVDEYQCKNRQCIDSTYHCDGEPDCQDRSDEAGCTNVICADDQFTCTKHPQCISLNWRCDNTADCRDESDEANCTVTAPKCPDYYFPCSLGFPKCIPIKWKCDGNPECEDSSDELRCDNIIDRCAWDEFHCSNKRQCIPTQRRCDGTRDCIDSSDEEDCPAEPKDKTKCPLKTHFRCPGDSGPCITAYKLCDGNEDCPGGEDEQRGPHFCGFDECAGGKGNCSHICNDLRLGYECDCPAGYKLRDDQRTCEDINECDSEFNPCEQFCMNKVGSHKCRCWLGYSLVPGTGRCKPTNASYDIKLLVADKGKIRKIDVNNDKLSKVISQQRRINGIAVDVEKDYVYWGDSRSETISRSRISKPSAEVLLTKSTVRSPNSLAVDWIHGHLYWSDVDYKTVSVSYLNGTFPRTLYRRSEAVLLSLAVHPKYGYLFMSSSSGHYKSGVIERCGMDGDEESCKVIIEETAGYLVDIALDYEQDLLYWVDEILQSIGVSKLDGEKKQSLLFTENYNPISLAVFSGRVYWTDREEHVVFSTNRTGKELQVVRVVVDAPSGMVVFHSKAQPQSSNYCLNSLCKYLCLPRTQTGDGNRKYACVCPDQYTVKEDDPTDCKWTATTTVRTKLATSIVTTGPSVTDKIGHAATASPAPQTHVLLAVLIISLLILTIVLLCFIYRWHKKRSERKSMTFNNPIYHKVTERPTSNSSLTVLDDQSLNSGGGEGAAVEVEDTADLILCEEMPEGSNHRPSNSAFDVKRSNGGNYAKVKSNNDIDYAGMTSSR